MPVSASAKKYQIGDRVKIGDLYGTVTKYGPGNEVFVLYDKFAAFPNSAVLADPDNDRNVQPAGAGAPPPPPQQPAEPQQPVAPVQPFVPPVQPPVPPVQPVAPVQPQQGGTGNFKVGDRVYNSMDNTFGTVIYADPKHLWVHLDNQDYAGPDVHVNWDPTLGVVQHTGQADPNGGQPDPNVAIPKDVFKPGDLPDVPIDPNAAPSEALFKQLILKHWQPLIDDPTSESISITYQNFQVTGPTQVQMPDGSTVPAWTVTTTYTINHHFSDPNAPDINRTYTNQTFSMYQEPVDGWTAHDVGLPGGPDGGENTQNQPVVK